jgi:PAS domain S-box-containing protein
LRETILELSAQLEETYPEELRVFNRILDRAMQQAVHRYAETRHRILNAVDRISMLAFGDKKTEDELLGALVKVMVDTAPEVDEVTILIRHGDRLFARKAIGITTGRDVRFSLAIGEGFSGTIAARREPLFTRSAETDPLVKSDFLRQHKLKALYGVPLIDGPHVIGVAHMGSVTAYEFLDEDMLLFRTMANRASQILVETRLQARIREQREELQLILKNARLGTFVHDVERDTIKWNERTRELFGVSREEPVDFERLLSLIAPIDRERVQQAAARAQDTGEEFKLPFRIDRQDGS